MKKRTSMCIGMLTVLLMAAGHASAQCCSPAPKAKRAATATDCAAQPAGCTTQGSCAGCPIGIVKNAKALGLTEGQTADIQRIMEGAFKKVQAQLTDAQKAKAKMICRNGACSLPASGCPKPCCAKSKKCGLNCTKPCCVVKGKACCASKAKAKTCAPGCKKPCCAAKTKACCAAASEKKCGPNCTKPCCR